MLGMSVFQMKATLTRSEYIGWLSYLRYEEPDVTEIQLATLAMLVSNAVGGKAKAKDFLVRKPDKVPSDKVMSMEAVKGIFSGVATPQK